MSQGRGTILVAAAAWLAGLCLLSGTASAIPTGWYTLNAPPDSLRIVLVERPASGIRTLTLSGDGRGSLQTVIPRQRGGDATNAVDFAFHPAVFDSLLQQCYQLGFFDMRSLYNIEYSVNRVENGRLEIGWSLLPDEPTVDLKVCRGQAEKVVTFLPRPGFCPPDLLEILQGVRALGERHAVTK